MPSADLIITNARLLTMNKAALRAESLAIAGNRILAVGSNAEVKALKASHIRETTLAPEISTLKPILTICDGRITFERQAA